MIKIERKYNMADNSLGQVYKDIMIRWGDACLSNLEKSRMEGNVAEDGYDNLRNAIIDKNAKLRDIDGETLLNDKYLESVQEARQKVEYLDGLLASADTSEEDKVEIAKIKELHEKYLSLSEEDFKRQLIEGARQMLEQMSNK